MENPRITLIYVNVILQKSLFKLIYRLRLELLSNEYHLVLRFLSGYSLKWTECYNTWTIVQNLISDKVLLLHWDRKNVYVVIVLRIRGVPLICVLSEYIRVTLRILALGLFYTFI